MRAEIVLYMPFGHTERITCDGSEMEIYSKAISWQEAEIADFIKINNISTPEEIELVNSIITHEIIWLEQTPMVYIVMDEADDVGVHAVFWHRADAEEYVYTAAEQWAYECIMIGDPWDMIGANEWDIKTDTWYLMTDYLRTVKIVEAPIIDTN